jgi:hypothetical protein
MDRCIRLHYRVSGALGIQCDFLATPRRVSALWLQQKHPAVNVCKVQTDWGNPHHLGTRYATAPLASPYDENVAQIGTSGSATMTPEAIPCLQRDITVSYDHYIFYT